jgi:hypothetical protein
MKDLEGNVNEYQIPDKIAPDGGNTAEFANNDDPATHREGSQAPAGNEAERTIYHADNPGEKPEASRGWSKRNKLLALIGIGAASIAAGVGGNMALNHGKVKPMGQPVAAASANPGEKPTEKASPSTPESQDYSVEDLEVSASMLSDPEMVSKTFNEELLTKWYNAGASIENAKAALHSDTESIPDAAARIAAEYDKKFIAALLIKNWESNPDLVEMVNKISLTHEQTLTLYFRTAFPDINPQDIEPYKRWTKVVKFDGVDNKTNNSVSFTDEYKDYDNADQNRAGEDLTDGKKVEDHLGKAAYKFVVENGKLKMADFKGMIVY